MTQVIMEDAIVVETMICFSVSLQQTLCKPVGSRSYSSCLYNPRINCGRKFQRHDDERKGKGASRFVGGCSEGEWVIQYQCLRPWNDHYAEYKHADFAFSTYMDRPLEGRAAIVTGSSRSIGAAIAKRLAQAGARVIINYLCNVQAANDVVNEIRASGGDAIAVQADAGTIAGGQTLLQQCLRAFGRVDILVLNAGGMPNGSLNDVDDAAFKSVYDLTVKGPLFLAQAVAPHLTEGASIANSLSL